MTHTSTNPNSKLYFVLAIFAAILIAYLAYKVQDLEKKFAQIDLKLTTLTQGAQPPADAPVDKAKVEAIFKDKNNIILGNRDAKLKIVEFSDPSCPWCHIASGLNPELGGDKFKPVSQGGTYNPPVAGIKKLIDEGKAQVAIMYANGHGAGEIATQALYCANLQGRFWEAHDLLYTKAGYDLINDVVKNDVAKSGEMASYLSPVLDAQALAECLGSKKFASKLAADQQVASGLGFGGTPMFIVADKRFNGAYDFKEMQTVVAEATK